MLAIKEFVLSLKSFLHPRASETKIRNKIGPETTERFVYVYSNSKMAVTIRDIDELKKFAWDNEDV